MRTVKEKHSCKKIITFVLCAASFFSICAFVSFNHTGDIISHDVDVMVLRFKQEQIKSWQEQLNYVYHSNVKVPFMNTKEAIKYWQEHRQ